MSGDGTLRVTMIGSLPPHKGISPYVHDLATALAQRNDVRLDVVAFRSLYPRALYPGGDPDDRSGARPQIPRARTRRALRWWNPIGWLAAGLTLRGDVIHAQWWSYVLAPPYLVVLACARLRRKRVILTVHNTEPHEGGLLRRLANGVVRPFAHQLIVHCETDRRSLYELGERRAVHVVPIGVNASAAPVAGARATARRRLSLDEDAPVVLFFGNIRPYKGLSCLLDSFGRVRRAVPQARLLIAGEVWGGATKDVLEEIGGLGLQDAVQARLSYVPADEVADYFEAADVVVYPYTHFNAQSAAACLAIAHGKAIVVTDVGGLPELAADARAVVPANDGARLADALIDVLTDNSLRARLEGHARTLASRTTWQAVAAATVRVYGALMEREARVAATAADAAR